MKLNLGCGHRHLDGCINIDKYPPADIILDLETELLPFQESFISEVVMTHSLEHVANFLHVFREIYRVCRGGSKVVVTVPHPRHDSFWSDPTHVRAWMPASFLLLSQEENLRALNAGWPNTPIGIQNGFDFAFRSVDYRFDSRITPEEFTITMEVVKSQPGGAI